MGSIKFHIFMLVMAVFVDRTFSQQRDNEQINEDSEEEIHATTASDVSDDAEVTSYSSHPGDLDARLERSRMARMFLIQQHVLDTLGWDHPPDIDPETKRKLLMGLQTPVYVTKQKFCYYPACDLPVVDLPDYVNRSIWFDTSSRNIRYFFNLPAEVDPNIDVSAAIVRLHLKRRQDCPCAYDDDPSTSRLHIKIYQYRKPIRSHSRLRHSNMRLIDAKMVTWDSARWVSLHVTDAVKRIMTRGRRNGGFEVHVRNMEEEVLDAKTVIDPTVCSLVADSECTHAYSPLDDEYEEQDDPNYSPVLEITTTTTSRIDLS